MGKRSGKFPDYEKLIPTEAQAEARFDTRELLRAGMAVASLGQVKDATVRLYIGEGQITVSDSEEAGEATVEAQAQGEAKTAISARYLSQVLKALGGMAEVKVKGPSDPILFTVDGYRVVVMPMSVRWGDEAQAEAEAEAPTEAQAQAEGEAVAEAEGEGESPAEAKPKRSRKKDPVPVEA